MDSEIWIVAYNGKRGVEKSIQITPEAAGAHAEKVQRRGATDISVYCYKLVQEIKVREGQ